MRKTTSFFASAFRMQIIMLSVVCISSCRQADIYLTIENGSGAPGSKNAIIEVSINNPVHAVKGIQADICDEGDYLRGVGCEPVGYASGFTCAYNEMSDGCFRIVLLSLSGDVIPEGEGPIIRISYDVAEDAPEGECTAITAKTVKVSDEDRNALRTVIREGSFCFF